MAVEECERAREWGRSGGRVQGEECMRGRECLCKRESARQSDSNKKELLSIPRECQGNCIREGNRFPCECVYCIVCIKVSEIHVRFLHRS